MKYLFSIVLVSLFVLNAQAQEKPLATPPAGRPQMQRPARPMMRPGQQIQEVQKADSVKLKAAFKELYPLIRSSQSVKERTDMALRRMDRMFKMQGVDSAKARDSVMAAINPNEEEVILYNAYAENFTADEIKSLATFFKTPVGKHYLEVDQRLVAANTQVDQYVQRTISMVTAPMRKPVERPNNGQGAPGMQPRPRPGMRPAPGQPAPAPGAPQATPPATEPAH